MRLFTAIELSDEIRTNVAAMQTRLRDTGADVKWSESENLHLTVKFIGDVADTHLPDIETTCEQIANRAAPFRFRIRGGSYFPKRGPNLKTLWVGVTDGASEWRALAQTAHNEFDWLGLPQEHSLVAHITLGRVRGETGMADLRTALASEAETDCGTQTANQIALIQSTLDPRGATYKTLRRWYLSGRV